MQELETELKSLIIDVLNLQSHKVEDIQSEAPLFGDGLGLDSIDALELGIALKKKYGLVLSEDAKENHAHFSSVRQLAAFVQSGRNTTVKTLEG